MFLKDRSVVGSWVGTELSILGGLALFGRVAPLMVLWWMAETTTDADMPVA